MAENKSFLVLVDFKVRGCKNKEDAKYQVRMRLTKIACLEEGKHFIIHSVDELLS